MPIKKHPYYRPQMDNRTWGQIVKDVDEYYARHKKDRKDDAINASESDMYERHSVFLGFSDK